MENHAGLMKQSAIHTNRGENHPMNHNLTSANLFIDISRAKLISTSSPYTDAPQCINSVTHIGWTSHARSYNRLKRDPPLIRLGKSTRCPTNARAQFLFFFFCETGMADAESRARSSCRKRFWRFLFKKKFLMKKK